MKTKQRIVAFLLTLVLLFNSLAIPSFAAGEETNPPTAGVEEEVYTPFTTDQIIEAVGRENILNLTEFDSVSLVNYADKWKDDRTYYDANGTAITDEAKLNAIKQALQKLGTRTSYSPTYTAGVGANTTATNNNIAINLAEENGNSYIRVADPISYEDYMALMGVYWMNGTKKDYLLNRSDAKYSLYSNPIYLQTIYYSQNQAGFDAAIAAGKANASFAISFDLRAGDLELSAAKDFNLITLGCFGASVTSIKDFMFVKLNVTTDGKYALKCRNIKQSSDDGSWDTVISDISKTDFTRITVLVKPETNTYDVMVDGVTAATDKGLLKNTEKNSLYVHEDKHVLIPIRTRTFNATAITDTTLPTDQARFDYAIGKTFFSIDNFATYYTDKFIECRHLWTHSYSQDLVNNTTTISSVCTRCGKTKSEVVSNPGAEVGTIKTKAELEKLGVTVKGVDVQKPSAGYSDGIVFPENNPGGDYYTIQKSTNENEFYVRYNDLSKSSTIDKISAARGQSFVVEGKFKAESELDDYGKSIDLVYLYTYFSVNDKGALAAHNITLVQLAPTGGLVSNGEVVGRLNDKDFTHVAVYVTPKTNSYDVYVDGVCTLHDAQFISDADKSKFIVPAGTAYNDTNAFPEDPTRPNGNFMNGPEDYIFSYTRNVKFYSPGLSVLPEVTLEDGTKVPGKILSFKDYYFYKTEQYYSCVTHEYNYVDHQHKADGTLNATYKCLFCGFSKTGAPEMDGNGNNLCDFCEADWKNTENPYRTYDEKVANLNAAGVEIVAAKDFDTATGYFGSSAVKDDLTVIDEYGNKYLMYSQTGPTQSNPSQVYTNLYNTWYPTPNSTKIAEHLQANAGKDFVVQTELKFGEEHIAKDEFEVFGIYSNMTSFYNGTTTSNNQLSASLCKVSSDGEILYYNGGSKKETGIFLTPGGDFVTVSVHVHPEKNSYDLYFDGKLYKSDITMVSASYLKRFSTCLIYYNVVGGQKVYDFVYHTLTSDKKNVDKRYLEISAGDTLDSDTVYYRATYSQYSNNSTCRYISSLTPLSKNASGSYTYPTDLGTNEIIVKEVTVSADGKSFVDGKGTVIGTICTMDDFAPTMIRMYQYASTTEQNRLCVNDTFFYYSDKFVENAVPTGKYVTSHTHSEGGFTITKTETDSPEKQYQISGVFGENGNLGEGAWVSKRSVGLADCVMITLYVSVDKTVALANDAAFHVTYKGETKIVKLSSLKQDKDGYYIISETVDSIDMTKPVSVKFYANGKLGDGEYTTSVKDYALELMELYPNKAYIVDMAKALLNYGAYAQKYFATKVGSEHNYDIDLNDLANKGAEINISSIFVDSTGLEPELTYTGDLSELQNVSASLVLVSGTKLKIYFDYSGKKVNFNNLTDSAASQTPLVDKDGNTYVVLNGIRPDQYHRVVSLTTKNGSEINTELRLSVLSVMNMVLNSSTASEEHKDLMKAMYNYHKCVLTYKEEVKNEQSDNGESGDISDVDPNFKVETNITDVEGLKFFDVENDPRFELYGVKREGDYLVRIPEATASAIGNDIVNVNRDTAGGRIRFTTNSPYVAIHIETDTIEGYSDMPLTGTTGVDVYRRNSAGEYTFATTIIPANSTVGKTVFEGYRNWYSSEIHDYTLNLPSFVNVKKVYIGLIEGSYIDAPMYEYEKTSPIVFYGGATTQGLGAARPGITYPSLIARRFDSDYINLGFENCTLGQEKMAEYIASLDMSAFVYDYGYGVDAAHLEATHKSFFDKIRASRPDLPIIITTKAASYAVPGHASFDIPYATYTSAVAAGDKNVYFISGNELVKYCGTDTFATGEMPTHVAIYSIAKVIGDKLEDIFAGKENVVYDPNTMIDTSIAGTNVELGTYGEADTSNIKWINPEEATNPMQIYGVFREGDRFVRLPESVAAAVRDEANTVKAGVGEGVHSLYDNTAGGRIRFKTDSKYIAIKVSMHSVGGGDKTSLLGMSGFDLYATVNGQETFIGSFVPPFGMKNGYEAVIPVSGDLYDYTINMPNYAGVYSIEIGVESGATLEEAAGYKSDKAIYFYGSSITQGASPSRPGLAYENIVSRALGYDFVNLGFSGSCKAEQAMIDYLVSIVDKMEMFVYDYDHNANSDAHYAETHERLFLALREAAPDLPILIMTRPNMGQTNSSRYKTAKATYDNAIARGDKNVYFLSGDDLTEFCGTEVAVDGTHPNDIGFYSMALKVIAVLEPIFSEE